MTQEFSVKTKTLKTVPKITVKIWRPIMDKLDEKIGAACLRRDAYLNKVLDVELGYLDEEVSIPNSQASYNYVFEKLDRLDRKLVSLALPSELTERLNNICKLKCIVRDAFFNRIFLLLAASPKVVNALLFGNQGDRWRANVWADNKNDGQFFQDQFYPLEPMIDPFWAIREGLKMYANDGGLEDYIEPTSGKSIQVKRDITGTIAPADNIYTTIFEQKVRDNDLLGLSCYMPDWRIPDHGAEQEHRAKLAKLDELLVI
jgi:hypothetical protein